VPGSEINDKSGNLWLQYVEIIGDDNKKGPDAQPHTVFPEVLIEGL
jgi:hypothetical protein